LSSLGCSSEQDQELRRHRVLLWMADEATTVKARKLEELHAVKDQVIENVQEQLEELEEEVQECGVMLTN
jgi:L-lactate utilization protein LutB